MKVLAIVLPLAIGTAAEAETVVSVLSTREVAITSTYTGAEITVFGAIDRDATTVARSGSYDVVVSVLGPTGNITVREKQRIGPLWINLGQRKFFEVPLYFALLSSRPIEDITTDVARERLKLTFESNLMMPPAASPAEKAQQTDFRFALERLQRANQLHIVQPNAVQMLRGNVFAATIPLPASAPTGLYVVNIGVLSDGLPLRTAQAGFIVRKTGIDAVLANAARGLPWLYGLATLAMAVSLGWLANVVFRRE